MTGGPDIDGLSFVRYLGGGGFGDVHLYSNDALRRMEAVKVVRPGEASDDLAATFQAEATAMAGLRHPHVVAVYGTGRTRTGLPYLAMQYYPGGTMEARAAGGRMPVVEVLRTGVQIGSALATAHQAGMLHRDIKPGNILIDEYDSTGLADFGVAAHVVEGADDGDIGVSVGYAPPEMLFTSTAGSPQTDVYSLTATLWCLLVGRSPFEIPHGDNSVHELRRRVRSMPVPVTGRADCPESLDRLLRWGMEKDPTRRVPSAAHLVRELQRIEEEQGWPRTPARIAVITPGTQAPPAPSPPPVRESGTVVRPRQATGRSRRAPDGRRADEVERAQTALRPRAAQTVPSHDPGGEGQTQLRPRVSTVTVDSAPDPVARGAARWRLVAAAVGLVLGALALVLVLGGRGAPEVVPRPRETVAAAPEVDELAPPPGPVTVTARRVGTTVTFAWTYDGMLSTDTYRLRFAGANDSTSDEPTVSVTAPPAGKACLSVIVVRADGSNPTREFPAPTCR